MEGRVTADKRIKGLRDWVRSFMKYLPMVYVAGVVVGSVAPFGETSRSLSSIHVLSFRLDYLLHALVFIPFYPLWRWARPGHRWWLVLGGGLAVAWLAEWVQLYLPYRAYNINDLLANMAGVLLGAALLEAWRSLRADKRN